MIGNDDCGQMSAWYILSSLGFYLVNAASGAFVLGSPQYKKAVIHLSNGKTLTLSANNFLATNIFTTHAVWQGKTVTDKTITYKSMMQGGHLVFDMCGE